MPKPSLKLAAAICSSLLAMSVTHAASAQEKLQIDIPAQDLSVALMQFGRQIGTEILFAPDVVRGKRVPALKGELERDEVLQRLLSGSGLTFRVTSQGAIVVEPHKTVEEVVVTGQYTEAVGMVSKTAQPLREIPHSISVMTRQRLEDQNLATVDDAMRNVTGVSVRSINPTGLMSSIMARGYSADTILIDGQPASSSSSVIAAMYADPAVLERIEVQRGAAGMFKGAGEPGVTVNMVRKRALSDFQLAAVASIGSWQAYRGELDVTGPITESGRLRGRAVVSLRDAESYWHNVDSHKQVAYGTLEYDVTDHATVSAGVIYQDVDTGMWYGLPTYNTGRQLGLPRSTSWAMDWTRYEARNIDGFLELEGRLSNGGHYKASLRQQERSAPYTIPSTAFVQANGNMTLNAIKFKGFHDGADDDDTETSADMYLSTPFEFGGQQHNLLIGADHRESVTNFNRAVASLGTVNVFSFNPDSIAEPPLSAYTLNLDEETEIHSYGIYTQVRIKPVSKLTLIGGARFSWWESETFSRLSNTVTSKYDANGEFTPYAAVLLDVSKNLSLYTSYAEIFVPQNLRTVGGEQIEPRVGGQYEVGIKGEFRDGLVNAHAAVYRIEDENRAMADPLNIGFYVPAGKVRAQGFETEVSGQLAPRWNLTAGYAFTETKYVIAPAAQQGTIFNTFTPKHSINLWTHYRFPIHVLGGLEVGAGVRSVSEFSAVSSNLRIEGKGYEVASLMFGYRIGSRYRISLNIENLLDETYLRTIGGVNLNQYGDPFNVTLGVRATW